MRISKHNYAIELAKQNNKVYFLNPLNADKSVKNFSVSEVKKIENLYVINLQVISNRLLLYIHYKMEFYWLYDYIIAKRVKNFSKKLKINFTQVWNFEPNYHGLYHQYSKGKKIYFIVDQIKHSVNLRNAKKADLVISVAEEILNNFHSYNKNCFLINHGINQVYKQYAENKLSQILEKNNQREYKTNRLQIGYIGNLLIPALFYEGLKQIIEENVDVDFHFWGSYTNNNLLTTDDNLPNVSAVHSIRKNFKNVFFYGPKTAEEIVNFFPQIDAFIYINSSSRDINGGANSHKIVEYLSSGMIVISTFLSFYKKENFISMIEKGQEDTYNQLFKSVLQNIELHNANDKIKMRLEYALDNTYAKNIQKIQQKLASLN